MSNEEEQDYSLVGESVTKVNVKDKVRKIINILKKDENISPVDVNRYEKLLRELLLFL